MTCSYYVNYSADEEETIPDLPSRKISYISKLVLVNSFTGCSASLRFIFQTYILI